MGEDWYVGATRNYVVVGVTVVACSGVEEGMFMGSLAIWVVVLLQCRWLLQGIRQGHLVGKVSWCLNIWLGGCVNYMGD